MSDNNDDRKRQKTEPAPIANLVSTTRSQKLDEKVGQFWKHMAQEVEDTGTDLAEFKTAQLPLARIKKIMKSDEDVRMISSEAPVLFAKACEFFILELTLRSWHIAELNKRKTLTKADVAAAVAATEVWDFLADTVPMEDWAEATAATAATAATTTGGQMNAPGMMMGAYPMGMVPGMQMYASGGVPAVYVQQQQGVEEDAEDADEEEEEEEQEEDDDR